MLLTRKSYLLFLVFSLLTILLSETQLRPAQAQATTWHGFYVDANSYEPGDTINIYGSAPAVDLVFRLIRLDHGWSEVARTSPVPVSPQASELGSFVEFPTVSLSGRSAFTLEGWFHPTLLGGDLVAVAGQIGEMESAAGIVVLPDGRLGGYVSDTPGTDQTKLAIAPAPPNLATWLDAWRHLALTYDGAEVKLYIDGNLAASRSQTGAVAAVSAPFRLGARAEAPGDLTGVADGRFDSWALWPAALSANSIENRYQRGLVETDPAPNPANVDLYLSFEGPYPSIADSSLNQHVGHLVNQGNAGVSGVTAAGRAFRLNHDQIVDADWALTAQLAIPADLPSGMYAIQALNGPDYLPTQGGDRLSVRAIAVRPPAGGPHATIAVVLPTNTWLAYNGWPSGYEGYLAGDGVTQRSRIPGAPLHDGGNNSAYGTMGDAMSLSYYHGLRRPSRQFSPMPTSAAIGGLSVRAPNSMYLMQWLDDRGYDYDVFSDDDFGQGLITAADYRVLMPHSHHEYWTDGMLAVLTQFLEEGGSVVAPAGNIFTWRTVFDADGVMEVRKFLKAPILGFADLQSGIDGDYMGSLRMAAACNGGDSYQELGVSIHLTKPCNNQPFCFGQWETQNSEHWLWQGTGLVDEDLFGIGRPTSGNDPAYVVGHEADTWLPGLAIPGLAPGQDPIVLAEGTNFGSLGDGDTGRAFDLAATIGTTLSCEDINSLVGSTPPDDTLAPATRAGSILYFPHVGGGHVLVIGASATPWALASDAILSRLTSRALDCFGYDHACGYSNYLPLTIGGS